MRTRRCFTIFRIFAVTVFIATASARADEPKRDPQQLSERSQAVKAQVDSQYEHLVGLYKHIHTHPELSRQEVTTAAKLAQEMTGLGFDVTSKVGGTGLVCIFK